MISVRNFICLFVLLFALISTANTACAAKDEAERLWELGEKAYNAGRYHEARSYYNKSLSQCVGNLECVASNLNGIGAVYEALDDDRTAFKYYEDALSAARKANNRDLIATNLFNTGAIYHRTFNQYEKALSLFEESLRLFRQLNDRKSAAIVLFNMGKSLNSLGRYDRSLSVLNESLRINRELNDQQGIAGSLNVIGNVYAGLGQYDKPLSYYQEALRINRRLNNFQETAVSLRNIGDAYCDLVERDKAISYYQEALDIQRKRKELRFDMVITHTNMGALYKGLDQYDKALSHFEESLKISREFGNTAMIATNLNNIGNVYASLGKSDAALSYYQQSLKLDRQLNRPQRIAVTLNNIGMEYFRLGRYEKALDYLYEALGIEKKLNNPHSIAARLNNIGAVYLRQKRYKEAESVFLERRNTGRRIAKTRLIHAGLVEVYLATKRYDEALALLRELPPNWRDSRNRRMEYHTQYGLALKGKGILREASLELLKAVSIIEEVRRSVGERSEFFAGGGYIGRLVPYRELMAVLSELADRGESQDNAFRLYGRDAASSAFYFAELTKARMFLEMMAGAARKYEEPQIPPDIRNKEASIIKELSSVEKDRESAFAKGEAAFHKLSRKEEELVKQLDTLVSYIRKHYPLYAALNYPKPIPATELPLKDNEVLIEFGISDNTVIVFDVRKGGVNKSHKATISGEELAEKVKTFIEPLNSGRFSEFSARSAKMLYDLLLSDTAKTLKDASEKLIVVPDGILGFLPFEALVVKGGKDYRDSTYAGDKWIITYSQSATSLALTRLLKPSTAKKPLFALGNPVYDKSDPRYIAYKQGKPGTVPAQNLKQYAFRGVTVLAKQGTPGDAVAWEELIYPALPETEDEVREIARLVGVKPDPPDILLGISATETNFRNAPLKEYRYLHFATHADLPGKVKGINEPFIILGQVENRGDDGFLTLSEVLQLKLNADLVVLSACSTGKGKITEGEGVGNFARAFEHAGAKSVVVSLWEVASNAAVDYMKSFYGHIKSGKEKAVALTLARKEIKAKYSHPFYWAVFVLYGEG
jgi:CHAT domain-containing protein/Tfp pilus assembly protein PilF